MLATTHCISAPREDGSIEGSRRGNKKRNRRKANLHAPDSRKTNAVKLLQTQASNPPIELKSFAELDELVKNSTKPVLVFFKDAEVMHEDHRIFDYNGEYVVGTKNHPLDNQEMAEHFEALHKEYANQIQFAEIDINQLEYNAGKEDTQKLFDLMYPDPRSRINWTPSYSPVFGRRIPTYLHKFDISHRLVLFNKGKQVLFKEPYGRHIVSLRRKPLWEDRDHKERRAISSQHKSPALMAKMIEESLGLKLSPQPESLYDF